MEYQVYKDTKNSRKQCQAVITQPHNCIQQSKQHKAMASFDSTEHDTDLVKVSILKTQKQNNALYTKIDKKESCIQRTHSVPKRPFGLFVTKMVLFSRGSITRPSNRNKKVCQICCPHHRNIAKNSSHSHQVEKRVLTTSLAFHDHLAL